MTAESKTESPSVPVPHTDALFGYLTQAFDFFNRKHWDGKLPPVVLNPHRNKKCFGYYHGGIFARIERGRFVGKADELALNPEFAATRKIEEVLSTLVHEMCHHWQNHFGKEPSRAYHDKQWGAEMKRVGLYPSATAQPGGKEIGQYISHYIIEGGPFAVACEEFLQQQTPVLFQDRASLARSGLTLGSLLGLDEGADEDEEDKPPAKKKSKGRAKFICPTCGLNAWAKPGAVLICGTDSVTMECEDEH